MAVGGAAYLVSKAIKSRQASSPSPTSAWKPSTSSKSVDMPVTVAVDANGTSVHTTGPAEWPARIAQSLPGTAVLQ